MEEVCVLLLLTAIVVHAAVYVYRYIKGRKALNKCMEFGKKTQNGEFPLYFNYKGKICGYDSDGDPILKQGYVDSYNKDVEVLLDVKREIRPIYLSSISDVPSRAYHVSVQALALKEKPNGVSIYPPVVEIFMQPLHGCRDMWTVVDTDFILTDRQGRKLHRVLFRHPVMGNLIFSKGYFSMNSDVQRAGGLKVGQTLIFEQNVDRLSSNPNRWSLTYHPIGILE